MAGLFMQKYLITRVIVYVIEMKALNVKSDFTLMKTRIR